MGEVEGVLARPERGSEVGLTTTVPVEAILAAGCVPVDLNNLFVSHPDRQRLMDIALAAGFPQGSCAWTRGIYGAVADRGGPGVVVGVVRGDCAGTELLLEALAMRGVRVLPFTYPYPADAADLSREVERFCAALGTTVAEAEAWLPRLAPVRRKLARLDELCWREGVVSGFEDHLWLVSASDLNGDPARFEAELDTFLAVVEERMPFPARPLPFGREVRLGYMGVPPIAPELFEQAESAGARFVFCEVQRQFAMLPAVEQDPPPDLVGMYLQYTYPYTVAGRAADINRECARRSLDGMVHYVQSFCHRNMEDVLFSRELDVPVLTVECDCPGELSAPARSRLENFIQVLGENQ